MKNEYSKPSMKVIQIRPSRLLEGSKYYTDDPQDPGSALSRKRWEQDEMDSDF